MLSEEELEVSYTNEWSSQSQVKGYTDTKSGRGEKGKHTNNTVTATCWITIWTGHHYKWHFGVCGQREIYTCAHWLTSCASQLLPTALPERTCSWLLWVSQPASSLLPYFLQKFQPCWDYCELQVKGQIKQRKKYYKAKVNPEDNKYNPKAPWQN